MKNEWKIGKIVDCPMCGKKFIPTVQWVYKTEYPRNYYCSYSCLRKLDDGEVKKFKNIARSMKFSKGGIGYGKV